MYNSEINRVLAQASKWIGSPYESKVPDETYPILGSTGIDCSNLLHQSLVGAGYDIPYNFTQNLWNAGYARPMASPVEARETELPFVIWRNMAPRIVLETFTTQLSSLDWTVHLPTFKERRDTTSNFWSTVNGGLRPLLKILSTEAIQAMMRQLFDPKTVKGICLRTSFGCIMDLQHPLR